MQINPRKIMQQDINAISEKVNQIAGGLSLVVKKIEHLDRSIAGCEQIIMKLAEFFGKESEFNDYLENWLKSDSEPSKETKSVNKAGDEDGDLTPVSSSSVPDKTSASNR